jgi:catechol 2,3-dioxygenase-like lactoylglutathione lyase family enzyme
MPPSSLLVVQKVLLKCSEVGSKIWGFVDLDVMGYAIPSIHPSTHTHMLHHTSIRTADIHRSIIFYECLGFVIAERFTTGYTLACWMEGMGGRLELIQIPEPKPAPDAFGDEHYVGFYHLSFDLTNLTPDLHTWLASFAITLQAADLAPPNILLPPSQQSIGTKVYEVAFITDPDNLPLELMRCFNRGELGVRSEE